MDSNQKKVVIELGGAESSPKEIKKFGTFHGVFRPTILTIIGVMLYVREGWVVGNAGFFGALTIILTAYVITGTTAFSISSITSNIRVGSGGVFSLISQSLGLEMGGAIGIPLYLAQALSAALYIHGFSEGWLFIFPEHEPYQIEILLSVFFTVFSLVFISTKLAFKVQLFIMLIIVVAFFSMFMGYYEKDSHYELTFLGEFKDGNFWNLFAIFFPAATGVMVGASMSGSLANPKKSIPIGTISAWFISLLIYVGAAFYYAKCYSTEELLSAKDSSAHIHAKWPILVLIGLTASCFTATLSSLAAAPRVLQALAEHKILPGHHWLSQTKKNEPRNAMLFTGAMVLFATIAGNLNNLAKIITMFFLLTYFTVNAVLAVEQQLNLISFRPQFKIPKYIPIIGSIICLVAIVIISPVLGLMAIGMIIAIYIYLDRKKLETPWETVHSGLFVSIANWAAKKVFIKDYKTPKRSWKPDLLVPVERSECFEGQFRLLRALCYPQGSIQAIGFKYDNANNKHFERLKPLVADIQKENIFASSAIIETSQYSTGLQATVSILKGSFFRPNTIFDNLENRNEKELQDVVNLAKANHLGVILLAMHKDSRLGREKSVNLWIRDQSPNWKIGMELTNLDYALLLSHQLKQNWNTEIRLICIVEEIENTTIATEFLNTLVDVTRMSSQINILVDHGKFIDHLATAPKADLNIFGISPEINRASMEKIVEVSRSSCLFVMDSGNESALT